MTLVILDADEVFSQDLIRWLSAAAPDVQVLATAHHSSAALPCILQHGPDVVVLDAHLPPEGGLAVIEALRRVKLRRGQLEGPPRILLLTSDDGTDFLQRASAAGADYCLMTPCRREVLLDRVRMLAQGPLGRSPGRLRQDRIRQEAIRQMTLLGVPSHFRGFQYLREAITLAVEDRTLLHRITKGLYPAVAERYGSTPEQVERAIRTAIEAAWTRGDLDALHQLFQHSVDQEKGKPTNASFIARLADEVDFTLRRARGS